MRIAIVGAAPAGCHLAYRLAATDYEILLLDPRTPWEKPCGGGLNPLAARLFPDVMALPFPRYHPPRLLIRVSDGGQVEHRLELSTRGVVSREDSGRALLKRALTNRRVRHLRK